jgi:hypothetical protein
MIPVCYLSQTAHLIKLYCNPADFQLKCSTGEVWGNSTMSFESNTFIPIQNATKVVLHFQADNVQQQQRSRFCTWQRWLQWRNEIKWGIGNRCFWRMFIIQKTAELN